MKQKVILAVLLLLAFGVRSAEGTQKKSLPNASQIATKVLRSLVVVETLDDDGRKRGLGSGFFVDPTLIATNYHVVEGASKIIVRKVIGGEVNGRDRYFAARIKAADSENDLAVIGVHMSIDGMPLTLAKQPVQVGAKIYAAGNPKGFEGTFSDGIVSGIRQSGHIQITAPISPGSSGGPVLNERGQVIGVATLTYLDGQNLNFAIPVSRLAHLRDVAISEDVDQFMSGRKSRQ